VDYQHFPASISFSYAKKRAQGYIRFCLGHTMKVQTGINGHGVYVLPGQPWFTVRVTGQRGIFRNTVALQPRCLHNSRCIFFSGYSFPVGRRPGNIFILAGIRFPAVQNIAKIHAKLLAGPQ
jgi:hypothetical protein